MLALTLALSPRRGNSYRLSRKVRTPLALSPLPDIVRKVSCTVTVRIRITQALPKVSPSPGGEGGGEGEHSHTKFFFKLSTRHTSILANIERACAERNRSFATLSTASCKPAGRIHCRTTRLR